MAQRALAGTRIRDRRLDRGMRQADLAREAGISASYLNLIEHNRRRIGGKVLADIARALGTDPAVLAEGAGDRLIETLRRAAAERPLAEAEVAQAGEFAGRFPGWARLVAEQEQRIAVLEARVAHLTDRLAHDPQLAASLHEVISAVTSIRSTAAILTGSGELDRDWTARFHQNIHADARRLAESSRSLVRYLGEEEGGREALSPQEAAAAILDRLGAHVAELEGAVPEGRVEEMAATLAGGDGAVHALVAGWLARYRADAVALPLGPLAAAARAADHDPARIAQALGADLARVLRRMAALPPQDGHPPFGLAIADGAGAVRHLRGMPGFTLAAAGPGCPQWPLWEALGRPGQPLRVRVRVAGAGEARLLCHAVAGPRGVAGFEQAPAMEAVMLVRSDPAPAGGGEAVRTVGLTCRICPAEGCPSRREPSVLAMTTGAATVL